MTDRDYEGYGLPDEDTDLEELDVVYRPRAYEELTLRDLFALTAMHAQVTARQGISGGSYLPELARQTYALADEMMMARR